MNNKRVKLVLTIAGSVFALVAIVTIFLNYNYRKGIKCLKNADYYNAVEHLKISLGKNRKDFLNTALDSLHNEEIEKNATLFHDTISLIDEYESISEYIYHGMDDDGLTDEEQSAYKIKEKPHLEKIKTTVFKNLESLGVLDDDTFKNTDNYYPEKLDIEFMEKFVELFSFDDLIHSMDSLLPLYFSGDYDEVIQLVAKKFYDSYSEKFISTSVFNLNSEGFYTDNPEAEPLPTSKRNTVYGRFNDASDGNRVYSSKQSFTDSTEVYYYGDFAVTEEITHGYSKGSYGWYGGTFVDEPAHYTTSTSHNVYYKGYRVKSADSTSLPQFQFYISEDGSKFYEYYKSSLDDDYYVEEISIMSSTSE